MTSIALYSLAGLIGLVIGSFLNVLIYRGPALWGLIDEERGSLWGPRSQCPNCRYQIPGWRNIPIFSYFLQKGKCANCAASIPASYPLVEALGGAAALMSVALYGASVEAIFAALFFWTLIALGLIDHQTGYLPDMLTLPLILGGILVNGFGLYTPLHSSIIGAIVGYGTFWAIAAYYKQLRGRDGLGLGDAKLLAALGAWCGWVALAPIVMVASISALLWVGASALSGRSISNESIIRFGPALAMAGIVIFVIRNFAQFPF